MLPNHAPLVIAEQFGTLAAMYPGRIDLGLGRAPGSDQNTMYALRRDPQSAESFPQDVLELQGYLTGNTRVAGRRRGAGQGLERAALHPRVLAVRRQARRGAGAAVRVRLALRAGGAGRCDRRLPRGVPPVRAAGVAVRDRGRERRRGRHDRGRAGAAAGDPPAAGDRAVRAVTGGLVQRPGLQRRGSRPAAGRGSGRARRRDAHRSRPSARRRRSASTSTSSVPGRAPTS